MTCSEKKIICKLGGALIPRATEMKFGLHSSIFSQLFKDLCSSSKPMKMCNAVLTFESVNKILYCDLSNETS